MPAPRQRAFALCIAAAFPRLLLLPALFPAVVYAQAAPPAAATPLVVEVTGTRQRLDAARNSLSPDTGSTSYRFDQQDIRNLPLGDGTPLNQVILQTPGVVQDSYGQLHVRGDHGNVQYRVNGVIIPEAISGFGQSLELRFADHLSVLTGALPAQYGYRTAGVVDIQTKGDIQDPVGHVGLTVGSRGHTEATLDAGGSSGNLNYYLTGSWLRDGVGIENPTAGSDALHDVTHQGKGFGTLGWLLGDDSRVSVIFGVTDNRFQIPNVPGQTPSYSLSGTPPKDSTTLDASQRERNRVGVLTYQASVGADADYQVSLFTRTTDVHYAPDPVGDLQYNGIAADILRRNNAQGLQADLSWRLGKAHTLRAGLFAQRETSTTDNQSSVFPADPAGNQTGSVPLVITDGTRIDGRLWGVYVQDEWQPTKALTVNYGLRWDQLNTVVDENQLSPRLGLVYEVSKDLRLHAGYARYFTPPPTEKIDTTSVAKFLGTTNALPSDANTAVKSERSDYFDAGLSLQLMPELTLGVDGYYRKVRHLQDEGQFGKALVYSAFNFAEGRIYGLDLSANYHAKALSGYVNLGMTHARGRAIETGQFNFDAAELAYIQDHWAHLDHEQWLSVSAGVSWRWSDTLGASADALMGTGLRNGFANTDRLPAYATLNVALTKAFDFGPAWGKLDTRLAVVNLLDRSYQLRDGTGIGVGAPQFGARRTLFVGATKAF